MFVPVVVIKFTLSMLQQVAYVLVELASLYLSIIIIGTVGKETMSSRHLI